MYYPGVLPFISTADKRGSLTKPNGVRTDGERRLRGTGRPCLASVGSLSLSSLSLGCGGPRREGESCSSHCPSPAGLVPASGDPESLGQETKEVCPDSWTKGVLSVGPTEAKDSQEQVGPWEAVLPLFRAPGSFFVSIHIYSGLLPQGSQ